MKRVAVVLAGCGNKDGSEITESASVLIALSQAGAEVRIFAPDVAFAVKNPVTGEPTGETRNVLREAARIARGQIAPLDELRASDFDAVVIPGGLGAKENLGPLAEVRRVITEFHAEGRPIGAVCIAPAVVAEVLKGVTITLGPDPDHEVCAVDDYVSDREHRVITTPAYLYADATPAEVFAGISAAMRELVEMA